MTVPGEPAAEPGRAGKDGRAVDRATAADLMNLAADMGPAPMQVGACLVFDAPAGFDVAAAQRLVAERVRAVPRLRQRLVRTPAGCGRPIWVDDPGFDIRSHVRHARCPAPGDRRALLDLAAGVLTEPLPRSRPLWAAVFVTGLAAGRAGLVVVFHHVLADGIGGLAVLASLVDGMPAPPPRSFPVPPPWPGRLAGEAWAARLRALGGVPGALRRTRQALAELGGRRTAHAVRTTLNRPTGRRRRLAVATAPLAAVRDFGHRHGGTVNDVLLAAVTGALRALLASRGEDAGTFVISVPVSARRSAVGGELGNLAGIMPVTLPADADLASRLTRTAAVTRARKAPVPGASATLLATAFRAVAWLRLLRFVMNHQHMVHTFVTDLRGPAERLEFNGAPVAEVIPITLTTGNVTVSFAALSYAGTFTVTLTADPDRMPDLPVLVDALRAELAECAASNGSAPPPGGGQPPGRTPP